MDDVQTQMVETIVGQLQFLADYTQDMSSHAFDPVLGLGIVGNRLGKLIAYLGRHAPRTSTLDASSGGTP